MPSTHPSRQTWRCPACRTLFGIVEGDRIEIRYKDAAFTVRGELETRCRRCQAPSKFSTVEAVR